MADEEKDESRSPDEALLEEARERLQNCIETSEDSRRKQLFDLKFASLDQWDSGIRAGREDTSQPGGPRPCLTIDKCQQYISQVVNDMRQNMPAIKARPVDDYGDSDTAEIYQDLTRHIEEQSTASVAYVTCGQSQVTVGEGYFRVVTEYVGEASFQQKIVIKPIPDMFTCYLGPHVMPDGSDAEYGFIIDEVPKDRFKREYPGKKHETSDFASLSENQRYWESEDSVWVVEYFYFDFEPIELLLLEDGQTVTREDYDSIPEEMRVGIVKTRKSAKKATKWCKLTGVEVLEKRGWPGKYIPIAKAIGKEAWVDGQHLVWGIVRPAIDSLRAYNYTFSAITEKLALAPKAPFIGAVGQFATMGDRWDKANSISYSRLEYDPVSIDNQMVPPPQRQQPTAMETALINQLQLIEHDIQTSLGMFKASLGQEQPQQSGKAILALTRESDTGTFNFPDGLALAIRHGGRIIVDLIPKIYDTKQIVRLLGEDGEHRSAMVDPNQEMASRQVVDQSGKVKKIYNLGVGTYDVTVTTGPSYNTRRMEAAAVFSDLANTAKDPASAAVMRYLAVKNSDFNGADKAVEMLKKLLPPGLADPEDGQPPIPPQAMQKMQEMQMQMQQMGQALQEAQGKLQQAESGVQAAQAKIQVAAGEGKAKHELRMQELSAEFQLKERAQQEELRLAREKAEAEIALEQEKTTMLQNLEVWKANLDAKTKLEVADIQAGVDLRVASMEAARQPAQQ